jgi:hypothetical protein
MTKHTDTPNEGADFWINTSIDDAIHLRVAERPDMAIQFPMPDDIEQRRRELFGDLPGTVRLFIGAKPF